MEPKSNTIFISLIFPNLISSLIFFSFISTSTAFGKINTNKNTFSISALQYLLNSKDYNRFDWYIQSYLKQHPDSSILHILKGYRYFNQAFDSRSSRVIRINDKTGGIPRKYPDNFVRYIPHDDIHLKFIYSKQLLKKAFESMENAKVLTPQRSDSFAQEELITTQSGQLNLLSKKIHNFNEKSSYLDKIEELILNTFSTDSKSIDNELKISILQMLLQINPGNSVIETELGKYHYTVGNIDSSHHYTLKAFRHDSINLRTLNNAIILSSIKGNFKEASDLARLKFKTSGKQIDLEQFILYTFTYDSSFAHSVQKRAEKLEYYNDSHSITAWLFSEPLDSGVVKNKKYFSGDLFHLNLPLFSINYKRNRDKIAYYSNKACTFFVYAVYDSAAYYNLNLLRSIKKDNRLGYSALFNLAAEYYAAGEYRLSFSRFLDLFKYYNGKQDCAVRYGLGVNYEAFGDYSNAKKQYSYVLSNPDDHYDHYYNEKYNLKDLATYRLKRLHGPKKNYLK